MISGSGFASKLGAPVLDGDFGEKTSFVSPSTTDTDSAGKDSTAPGKDSNGTSTKTSGGASTQSGGGKGSPTGKGLSDSSKIAIVASLVVLFVIVAVVVGVFVYRKHKADQAAGVPTSEFASASSDKQGQNAEDVYEPQYHPKAELGSIFGAGFDPDRQREKVNKADDVDQEDEEEYSPTKLV